MIKCVTGKKVYLTQELAEEALIGAHTRFYYAKGQGPVAVYRCDDCGYFHLTSQGPLNTQLAQYIKNGKMNKQKEADKWLRKLKLKA